MTMRRPARKPSKYDPPPVRKVDPPADHPCATCGAASASFGFGGNARAGIPYIWKCGPCSAAEPTAVPA